MSSRSAEINCIFNLFQWIFSLQVPPSRDNQILKIKHTINKNWTCSRSYFHESAQLNWLFSVSCACGSTCLRSLDNKTLFFSWWAKQIFAVLKVNKLCLNSGLQSNHSWAWIKFGKVTRVVLLTPDPNWLAFYIKLWHAISCIIYRTWSHYISMEDHNFLVNVDLADSKRIQFLGNSQGKKNLDFS